MINSICKHNCPSCYAKPVCAVSAILDQQGSIYVFILLIFVYAWAMGRLDRKYDVHDDD